MSIMVANLCSYSIANLFSMSQFNTALTLSKMPYLPFMFYSSLYKKKVGEFMEEHTESFELDNTYIMDVLEFYGKKEFFITSEFIPVVENHNSMLMEGSVQTHDIIEYIIKIAGALSNEAEKGTTSELVRKFTNKLNTINREENNENVPLKDLFAKIPKHLEQWLLSLKQNCASIDFLASGLTIVQGKGDTSGYEERFLNAIRKVRERAHEKAAGSPPDPNRIIDEYYLFTKLVLYKMKIEWKHPIVRFNSYPICVDAGTKLIKVHYLFQMLGVKTIFVMKKGAIIGKIMLDKFLNLRYTQQTFI